MHRFMSIFLLLLLSGGLTGCASLHRWLNTEPEFMSAKPASQDDPARHSGIASDLNDAEYAEYQQIRRTSEEERRRQDREFFGF